MSYLSYTVLILRSRVLSLLLSLYSNWERQPLLTMSFETYVPACRCLCLALFSWAYWEATSINLDFQLKSLNHGFRNRFKTPALGKESKFWPLSGRTKCNSQSVANGRLIWQCLKGDASCTPFPQLAHECTSRSNDIWLWGNWRLLSWLERRNLLALLVVSFLLWVTMEWPNWI